MQGENEMMIEIPRKTKTSSLDGGDLWQPF